ncbi:MAG: ComF family protein [Burkholderiaceae bacterium]
MLRSLAYRLLPPPCVVCGLEPGAPSTSICQHCETDFFALETARCERCALRLPGANSGAPRVCGRCLAEMPHFDTTITLADYVSPVDGMVMALKFTARLDLAQFFGQLLASRLSALSTSTKDSVVIPVPLAFERTRQRGFNQSHHIARAFAAAAGLRFLTDRLLRIRHTAPQQTLALNERRRNVRGAFAVEGSVSGQHVFVVDDVMTTGSTLNEVAHVLKQAGASQVNNLIVARTP